MKIKALQLTANSAFQLGFGSLLASTLGASATFGGADVHPDPIALLQASPSFVVR